MTAANTEIAAETPRGPVWAAHLFLFSLLAPFNLNVGSLLLMPHRIVLLALFVPFFIQLFILRRAGPVLAIDWLMFCSTLWAGLALLVNHRDIGQVIEPFGIHVIEFFGGYLVARVAIRSASDFRRMIRVFFLIMAALLPFAALESITQRPILLDLLPDGAINPVNAGVRFGMRRAQTVFAHPILFGVFASTGLGLFWYALRPRWARFPAALITGLATVFSLSTGALISYVMQTVFISWEMVLKSIRRRWALFATLSVIGYFVLDLISSRTPFHLLVNYATFSSGSAYNRIRIWNFGTANIRDHPIFGLGLNDWVRPSWMSGSIDNFWLLIGMRYGLPAIAMVVLALVLILRQHARTPVEDRDDQLCRAAYLTTFGGLVIAGGTVHYWHGMMAFVLFIIGSGMWLISGGAARQGTPPPQAADPELPRSPYTRQKGLQKPIGSSSVRRPGLHARQEPRRKAGRAPRP